MATSGKLVERFGVALRTGGQAAAVARCRRGERSGPVPGGKQGGVSGRAARPGAVRMAARLVPPAQDGAGGVQFGAAGNDHRRSERLPAVLVRARPLDQHRPLRHRQGEQGGVQPDVVGAVVAVAAGPVDVDHPDALRRPLQGLGEGGAQLERTLGVRPDGQAPVAFEARGGGGGAERRVHQERTRIGGADGCGRHARRRRTAVQNRDGLGRRRAQGGTTVGGQARRRRTVPQQWRGLGLSRARRAARSATRGRAAGGRRISARLRLPAGARRQHAVRRVCLLLALRRHRHEAAVHHHRQHPAHGARRIRRQRGKPLSVAGRAQHPAVHHARQPQVMHEVAGAAHHPVHPPPRPLPPRGEGPVRECARRGVPVGGWGGG